MYIYRIVDKRTDGFGTIVHFADSDARMIREIIVVKSRDEYNLWRMFGKDYELYRVGEVDPSHLHLTDIDPIFLGTLDKFDVPPSEDGETA